VALPQLDGERSGVDVDLGAIRVGEVQLDHEGRGVVD
jgi:hypothetical protein